MVVKIRLARFGRRKAPFYNIVVAQARSARNSRPIEVLGTYDPIPKEPKEPGGKKWKDIKLDSVRAKYWIGVGAQPSDPAWRLLSMAGILEPKYRPNVPPTEYDRKKPPPEISEQINKSQILWEQRRLEAESKYGRREEVSLLQDEEGEAQGEGWEEVEGGEDGEGSGKSWVDGEEGREPVLRN